MPEMKRVGGRIKPTAVVPLTESRTAWTSSAVRRAHSGSSAAKAVQICSSAAGTEST